VCTPFGAETLKNDPCTEMLGNLPLYGEVRLTVNTGFSEPALLTGQSTSTQTHSCMPSGHPSLYITRGTLHSNSRLGFSVRWLSRTRTRNNTNTNKTDEANAAASAAGRSGNARALRKQSKGGVIREGEGHWQKFSAGLVNTYTSTRVVLVLHAAWHRS